MRDKSDKILRGALQAFGEAQKKLEERGVSYGGMSVDDYMPFGATSYLQMVFLKAARAVSSWKVHQQQEIAADHELGGLESASKEERDELDESLDSLEDSLVDLINYAAFAYAYVRIELMQFRGLPWLQPEKESGLKEFIFIPIGTPKTPAHAKHHDRDEVKNIRPTREWVAADFNTAIGCLLRQGLEDYPQLRAKYEEIWDSSSEADKNEVSQTEYFDTAVERLFLYIHQMCRRGGYL